MFCLSMFCLPAFGQSAKLVYTEKLPYNSRLTPEAAMTNAWNWFDNNTKLDPNEKEAKIRNAQGVFKGISSFQYVSKVASGNEYSKGTIYYTVRLRIHDTEGAYTYEITNFSHQARFRSILLPLTTAILTTWRATICGTTWFGKTSASKWISTPRNWPPA